MAKRISKRSSSARSQEKRKKKHSAQPAKRSSRSKRLKKRVSRSPRRFFSQRTRPQIKIKRAKRKKIKKIPKSLAKVKEKSFDFQARKIKMEVVGIGGGGGSIISEIAPKLRKIKFLAANTDLQALKKLTKEVEKFQFGQNLTQGLGTGMNPELAEKVAAGEGERIKKIFQGQDFSILISCLGGGTGSGAAPVFTKLAKDLKSYTLGIFTFPFLFEGEKRQELALSALEKIKPNLNAIIIFPNERIFQVISQKTPLREAFSAVNKILAKNLEGLIEMLYSPGLINIDFADLKTILSGRGGLSFLNTVLVQGENRAEEGAKKILENPFYEYKITGADRILFNISSGKDLKITEVEKISKSIADSNRKAKIIFGISENEKYRGKIKITLLAVGCDDKAKTPPQPKRKRRKTSIIKKITEVIPRPQKDKQQSTTRKKKTKPKPRPKTSSSGPPQTVQSKASAEHQTKEEKGNMTTRRTALELREETEKAEKEYLKNDAEWDVPAFLRKRSRE